MAWKIRCDLLNTLFSHQQTKLGQPLIKVCQIEIPTFIMYIIYIYTYMYNVYTYSKCTAKFPKISHTFLKNFFFQNHYTRHNAAKIPWLNCYERLENIYHEITGATKFKCNFRRILPRFNCVLSYKILFLPTIAVKIRWEKCFCNNKRTDLLIGLSIAGFITYGRARGWFDHMIETAHAINLSIIIFR